MFLLISHSYILIPYPTYAAYMYDHVTYLAFLVLCRTLHMKHRLWNYIRNVIEIQIYAGVDGEYWSSLDIMQYHSRKPMNDEQSHILFPYAIADIHIEF